MKTELYKISMSAFNKEDLVGLKLLRCGVQRSCSAVVLWKPYDGISCRYHSVLSWRTGTVFQHLIFIMPSTSLTY